MLASIIALLPTILPYLLSAIAGIVGWFQQRSADQAAAGQAESAAVVQHQQDGSQSVADKDSADAQNVDLDAQAAQMDNPSKAEVKK